VSPLEQAARDAAAAAEDQLSPGDVVANRYLLTSVLGEGGMGAVWLARDLKLDIDVALKFIHREVATETNTERLLQEARAVARLDHASIVRIFDFGEADTGESFMAMEVLRGELFSEVLERKGRLAPPNAVCTLLPVASAVAAAHARGVVHRDIKPENILLVTSDVTGSVVPKVLDFGIAQLRHKGQKVRRITANDAIVGTPDYMPPEQASGVGEVDHRADVWALCVVLYEAITGQRPFPGETPAMVLIAIATQPPKPIVDYGIGDDALWQILKKGLEKEANDRFPTMRELGSALARWAVDNGAETDVAGTSLAVHWLAERTRRPLSEVPVALEIPPPPNVPDTAATAATVPAAAMQRASTPEPPRPKPAAARVATPRTGGTWPPRAVARATSEMADLEQLVRPVSLPPELEPGRRHRWAWWLVGAAAVAAAVLAIRNPTSTRAVWDVIFGPKPDPASSTEPPTASSTTPAAPRRDPTHAPTHTTAAPTAKPSAPPLPRKK